MQLPIFLVPLLLLILSTRAQAPSDCSDPADVTGVTTACWATLNVTDTLTAWAAANNGCAAPFSVCFLGSIGQNNGDCTTITSSTCSIPNWSLYKANNISVQSFYIAHSIFSIYSFFNSYYTAIEYARGHAAENVGNITIALDVPQTTNTLFDSLLTAFGSILTITTGQPGLDQALNAIVQATAVLKFAFPVGSADSREVQWADVDAALGEVADNWEGNVTQALASIQEDVATFSAVAGGGAFATSPVASIPALVDTSLVGLNTFVVSQSLQNNQWQIARADVEILSVADSQRDDGDSSTAGCTGYDSGSFCGSWWYDSGSNVSYSLTSYLDQGKDPSDVFGILEKYSTGPLLFSGAVQCAGGTPSINTDGGAVTTTCLSNFKVCT